MYDDKDEFHYCPHCRRRTRHRAFRERVLAAVLWCQSCWQTRVGDEPAPMKAA
ncbi:MAG: hypothetical protein ACM31L_03700 [Actinomycetota bacterium]